jgi:hypothetical protein
MKMHSTPNVHFYGNNETKNQKKIVLKKNQNIHFYFF